MNFSFHGGTWGRAGARLWIVGGWIWPALSGFGRLYNAAGVAAQDSQSRFASAGPGAYLERRRIGLIS
jgi:hypothetical protein